MAWIHTDIHDPAITTGPSASSCVSIECSQRSCGESNLIPILQREKLRLRESRYLSHLPRSCLKEESGSRTPLEQDATLTGAGRDPNQCFTYETAGHRDPKRESSHLSVDNFVFPHPRGSSAHGRNSLSQLSSKLQAKPALLARRFCLH